MLRKAIFFLLTFTAVSHGGLLAQALTQTVRGKIIDEDSQTPLPGANVIVLDHTNLGTSTDLNGYFRIENVPVGRITLAVSFIGYENRLIPNLLVTSGKELVIDIVLKESLVMMEAIEVRAGSDKSQVANEMALTSARGFTVEETKRYAGSFNDPARMVAGYAGVDVDASGDNSIIVRGNSPKGIQWRLEGIDIPNPNHFADEGATGGPINALNSQMLANSEFYTGAFPAEFGNALSGVFDMKLRKGNNEKREYSFSVGILGTDVTAEGPFKTGGNSSYLVNYRYSTLSLLNSLGVVDFDGIPKYQDLSFKFHLPTKSLGTFSVFGLGGKSNITEEEFDEEDEDRLLERGNYKAEMGVVGVTHYLPLSERTYFQNSISLSRNGSGYEGYKPTADDVLRQEMDFSMTKNSVKAATTLNHKVNAMHLIQAGYIYTHHSFNFYTRGYEKEFDEFVTTQNMNGSAEQYQAFASWKYRPFQDLTIVGGVHAQQTSLDTKISIEPRASIRWQFHPMQAFTGGFGIHGKMEPLPNYYALVRRDNGTSYMPNADLDFSKARHYVVGYENKLSSNLFLKLEAYYQYLYNVPVEDDPNSSYSSLNQIEDFTDRALVNKGEGENMGIELTVERYFADSYYFLVTASLFDSKYTALDGIERNTLFNGNFVGNVLFGKEFQLNSRKNKNKVIGINAKVSSLGGRRYTPIDLQASMARNETVFEEDQAFSKRGDTVFIANLAISYRIDSKRISQEFKIDIQNATNNEAALGYYFDSNHQKIETMDQLPLLPVFLYTIHF